MTFSTAILKPRPSATRSALIGYFGLLGLIATIRNVSVRLSLQLPISLWWLCPCDTSAFGKISEAG